MSTFVFKVELDSDIKRLSIRDGEVENYKHIIKIDSICKILTFSSYIKTQARITNISQLF